MASRVETTGNVFKKLLFTIKRPSLNNNTSRESL